MLVIALQPTNNDSSLGIGEELGIVGEVLNDPERQEPCRDRGETFQNKYPRPTRFPADPIHLRDCDLVGTQISGNSREVTRSAYSEQTTKCARYRSR